MGIKLTLFPSFALLMCLAHFFFLCNVEESACWTIFLVIKFFVVFPLPSSVSTFCCFVVRQQQQQLLSCWKGWCRPFSHFHFPSFQFYVILPLSDDWWLSQLVLLVLFPPFHFFVVCSRREEKSFCQRERGEKMPQKNILLFFVVGGGGGGGGGRWHFDWVVCWVGRHICPSFPSSLNFSQFFSSFLSFFCLVEEHSHFQQHLRCFLFFCCQQTVSGFFRRWQWPSLFFTSAVDRNFFFSSSSSFLLPGQALKLLRISACYRNRRPLSEGKGIVCLKKRKEAEENQWENQRQLVQNTNVFVLFCSVVIERLIALDRRRKLFDDSPKGENWRALKLWLLFAFSADVLSFFYFGFSF